MILRATFTPIGVACLALVLLPAPAHAEIIAVSSDVAIIDEATGRGRRIGSTGAYLPYAMAMHPSGTLYLSAWGLGSERVQLVTIDLVTGAIKGGPTIFIASAFAFSPDGTLFAIRHWSVGPDDVYTIEVGTGASRLVGSTGLPGMVAMDFSPEGTLYGWDFGDNSGVGGLGLVTIDTVTGVATDVDPTVNAPGPGPSPVGGLAFAPDGRLYAGGSNLFGVEVNTGALTVIGPIDLPMFFVQDMAWIPEPSTLAGLLTMAAMALVAHLCRRKRKPAT